MIRTGMQSVTFPVNEIVVKYDYDAMDVIFDLAIPGYIDLLYQYHDYKQPALNVIKSRKNNCYALFMYLPPKGLRLRKGQLYQVYLANSLEELRAHFLNIKFNTDSSDLFHKASQVVDFVDQMILKERNVKYY